MSFYAAGQTALITGASSGLGREIALALGKLGCSLILTARRKELLEELAAKIRNDYEVSVTVLPFDLSEHRAATHLYEKLKELHLYPSLLINNAAVGCSGEFARSSLSEDLALLNLNLTSVMELTHLLLPTLIEKQGRVLNISSIASLMPGPYMAIYYACKAFLTSFSIALAVELKDHGVSVSVVLPGPMNTGFVKASRLQQTLISKLFTASPKKVAKKSLAAMFKGRRCVIAGTPLWLRGCLWLIPLTPKGITLYILKRLQKPKKS